MSTEPDPPDWQHAEEQQQDPPDGRGPRRSEEKMNELLGDPEEE